KVKTTLASVAIGVLGCLLIALSILFVSGYVKKKKPTIPIEARIEVEWTGSLSLTAGQSSDVLRPALSVVYVPQSGSSYPVMDYVLEGTLKAGRNVITISYGEAEYQLIVYADGIDGTEGLVYTRMEEEYAVSGYQGSNREVELPLWYEGLPVTAIGDRAFADSAVTRITLTESIASIGQEAFAGSALSKITLPKSLVTIGSGAFRECEALASVEILGDVLGESMFVDCDALEAVTFGGAVEVIPNSCFADCSALSKITLPETVKEIAPYAFAICTKLSMVYLPNGIETICSQAFAYMGLLSYLHYDGTEEEWNAVALEEGWHESTTLGTVIFDREDRDWVIID
ncbi:MAG: leucine-rich repeat domain-containing protein, partial [Christensenellaceae bacterium]